MEDTNPKAFVFVLMPFSEDFNDIYEVGIKPACRDAGGYCERVDEQIFTETILERVYNQIAKADVVVADMTTRNPNVFYETGYAHALNKQVILLTQNASDIPFDLKHYPHIVYGGRITTLKTQLKAKVQWCIENPKISLSRADTNLNLFINSVPLVDEAEISIKRNHSYVFLRIDIYNPSEIVIDPTYYRLAVITPRHVIPNDEKVRAVIQQPNLTCISNINGFDSLFPKGWDSITIRLSLEERKTEPVKITLRLYTVVGFKDYPCTLNIVD